MQPETIGFHYKFSLSNGSTKEFEVRLEEETLRMLPARRSTVPDWVRLSYQQCPNCPFEESRCPHCPIAWNIVEVIDFAKGALSYEEVDVEISSAERIYRKRTALQNALSSLIGIYMTTSGCPVLDRLRPLVRTHLPFASMKETAYRVVSMYLMAQYFLKKRGQDPDWDLKGLAHIYSEIQIVNDYFCKRIMDVHKLDAGLNAVFHLNCYAWFTNVSIMEKGLVEVERFFGAYLKDNRNFQAEGDKEENA